MKNLCRGEAKRLIVFSITNLLNFIKNLYGHSKSVRQQVGGGAGPRLCVLNYLLSTQANLYRAIG